MEPVHTKYHEAETFVFPKAITLKVLLSGSQTNGHSAVFEDIVEAGVGPGRHIHHNQDETFFFLEGDFIAEIDGKSYTMKPGDVAFIPRGSVHAFKNIGSKPGRLRYVFSPALTMEDMFKELFELHEQSGDLSFEGMSEIALRHGQEFVGPPL